MSDPSCDYCGEDSCLCPPHLKKQDDSWAMVGHHRETAPLDIATDVAASIYVRVAVGWADGQCTVDEQTLGIAARNAIRCGRIFAEAVAKEGK